MIRECVLYDHLNNPTACKIGYECIIIVILAVELDPTSQTLFNGTKSQMCLITQMCLHEGHVVLFSFSFQEF